MAKFIHIAAMDARNWQFLIDVGGTFTDCLARGPGGEWLRCKLLSSGVARDRAGGESTARRIVRRLPRDEPKGFWNGATLRLLGETGETLASAVVAQSDPDDGSLWLVHPLPAAPAEGQLIELDAGQPAPLLAIRWLLGLARGDEWPSVDVRLGTTRGTNALLTRTGARVGFVTTRGLADVLRIGNQNRPRLFELDIRRPEPLYTAVAEIDERIAASGEVLRAVEPVQIRQALRALREQGCEALAVCLLNAYRRPDHELAVAEVARSLGFGQVSLSHQAAQLAKIVARGDTTVVDAYLNPCLSDYLAQIGGGVGRGRLQLMTSAGTLVGAAHFTGKDSILSGPAGGVIGFSRAAEAAGFTTAIGFDMGGTSTDVARYEGEPQLEYETEKAGVRVVAPILAIETVAAGGGSIAWFDGVKLCVGAQSAGADPGPACYGRGGPLAVTDLNFFLGRLLPERFPLPLARGPVEGRLDSLAAEVAVGTGHPYSREALCEGLLRVANTTMVRAIRSVSLAKGRDPRQFLLVAFGGAAAQHACGVARELQMNQVLVPEDASLLSAAGLGQAQLARHGAAGVYRPLREFPPERLRELFDALAASAAGTLRDEGVAPEEIEVLRSLDLRYQGLDASLNIAEPAEGLDYASAFAAEHRRRFGYVHARPLELVAARVQVRRRREAPAALAAAPLATSAAQASGRQLSYFEGQWSEVPVFDRERLSPGDWLEGPALIGEAHSVTVVEPGWRAQCLASGGLLLTDRQGLGSSQASTAEDPVTLEVFHHQFTGIAERMGHVLRSTASSVNVKERLDYSCALFDRQGHLIVNAPHIPVHLGAMGQTVRRLLVDFPDLAPGDVLLTNDPYRGGSHLPDVTVVTPVHDPHSGELLFFTANRAHHAELGGIRPGSMPPNSRNLAEEGVLLRGFRLVAGGESRFDELERRLREAPYPSRAVADNLADVAAQVAANRQGAADLSALVARWSWPVVSAYMGHIQRAAERKLRQALARVPDGIHRFEDHLDDGTPIAVAIEVRGDEATIDFTGSGPVSPGNLNANPAIVTAAVMYVLRVLIDEDIPLNEGVLRPVTIRVPPGILNPPEHDDPGDCAAVVGGNVETSQRVVDTLLGALGLAAASQGTMNNLLFGDETFGYYETICGGAGATPHAAGASAVHTHMTNTRLTDPEVLEQRYPVRVEQFSLRPGSGGAGRHRGGDGIVRRLRFLKPLEVSLLSERRGAYRPYGLAGGGPGAAGRNTLIRADGTTQPLAGRVQFTAQAGDQLEIQSPGGGGYGPELSARQP